MSALKIIIESVLAFSVLGALSGWLLGLLVPGYYQTMFPRADSTMTDLGIGLGLTQGFGLGAFVGLFIVGLEAWKSTRKP